MTKQTAAAAKQVPGGPVSVVLPADLRRRLQSEARKRGLKISPAVRVLLSERFDDLDEAERLTRAEEWQRAEAWATWERLEAGDHREVSRTEIDAEFDAALRIETRRASRSA